MRQLAGEVDNEGSGVAVPPVPRDGLRHTFCRSFYASYPRCSTPRPSGRIETPTAGAGPPARRVAVPPVPRDGLRHHGDEPHAVTNRVAVPPVPRDGLRPRCSSCRASRPCCSTPRPSGRIETASEQPKKPIDFVAVPPVPRDGLRLVAGRRRNQAADVAVPPVPRDGLRQPRELQEERRRHVAVPPVPRDGLRLQHARRRVDKVLLQYPPSLGTD